MSVLASAGADPQTTLPDGTNALMTALIPTRGLGVFGLGDRRERYRGPTDIASKADGEDEGITVATATRALESGVGINAVNKDGDTVLHMAAGLAPSHVIRFLVEKGASLEAKNARGMTPLGAVNARPDLRTQGGFLYGLLTAEEKERISSLLRKLGARE